MSRWASVLRLGVTATVVEDTIDTLDGRKTEDLGGAYYALSALAAAARERVRIVPVLAVGEDLHERVADDLAARHLAVDGLVRDPAINNKVAIRYRQRGGRDETLTGGVAPLEWHHLEPWIDCIDTWYWNFVSGRETTRATFNRLKRSFAGPIYLDLHSLCLGPPGAGPRRPHRPDQWESWVEGAAWVQLNAAEGGLIARGEATPLDDDRERALAARIHALGARGVLITLGSRGARWYPADGPRVNAGAIGGPAVDPTGCGDVFGATWLVFHAGYGMCAERALGPAVRAAGVAAALRGTTGLQAALAAAIVDQPANAKPHGRLP